jgi:hypothetical protein
MNAANETQDLDRINSFVEWCRRANISPATGRRLIAAGKGPTITWLSERRMGKWGNPRPSYRRAGPNVQGQGCQPRPALRIHRLRHGRTAPS